MSNMTAKVLWQLFNKSFQKQIEATFDIEFAKSVMKRAKPEFFRMIPGAALIGEHNPKLVDLVITALVASIYKSGEGKISPKQMGTIFTGGMESVYMFRKFCALKNNFSKKWQDKRNAQAEKSQKREYPGDFVCQFIFGKTDDEYGIRYSECAIYKLLKKEACAELIPLMCEFDYIMAKYMNAELKRTKTLATGGDYCDFWYTNKK